ncbi:hypothetical protein G9A89_014238 [Geosiphon pyriformis]|nr:hypothetical protein G9A89_014238 [Geosiphon pyriformis]
MSNFIESHRFQISSSKFPTIAPEIFIKICTDLHPIDLLTLARVCRTFRQYLVSENSTSTNLVWKQARENFLPHYSLPAPPSTTELEYIRLIVEKNCQLCGKKYTFGYRPYFEFMVRCCPTCFNKNLLGVREVKSMFNMNSHILLCLPSFDRGGLKFWIPQVKKFNEEYLTIPDEEKSKWFNQQVIETRNRMSDAHARNANRQNWLNDRVKEIREKQKLRQEAIFAKMTELAAETNNDGTKKFEEVILRFTRYSMDRFFNWGSTQPFSDRSWHMIRPKILAEYAVQYKKFYMKRENE